MAEGITTLAGGPAMGGVGPTVRRLARVTSIMMGPRGTTIMGQPAASRAGSDQYQMVAVVTVAQPYSSGTLYFVDDELPKPLERGQLVEVVMTVRVLEAPIARGTVVPPAVWPPNIP